MLELDVLATRYNRLPSEVVRVSPDDYALNLLVARVAIDQEVSDAKKQRMKIKSQGRAR